MGWNILVVADEDVRNASQTTLREEGHEVLTAGNYCQALNILDETNIDLIFAEISRGIRSMTDFLDAVKARGLTCPVVMIVNKPGSKMVARAASLGVFDCLSKPVSRNVLLRVTRIALAYSQLFHEKSRADEEREKCRQGLEAVLNGIHDAVIVADKNMQIIEANHAAENICGVTSADLIGKVFGGHNANCCLSCLKVLKNTMETRRTILDYLVECTHQNRPDQVLVVNSSPLLGSENRLLGAVLVMRDVTRLTELEKDLKERHELQNIIGKSRVMQETFKLIEHMANTETTVLITGERGVGKGLVARVLHHLSPRAFKPMVSINCSMFSESVLESELFGDAIGIFAGAIRDKRGKLQVAEGGFIYLEEIGQTSPMNQAKLLRLLQDREFERVGDSKPIKADVRVIASTSMDLFQKVRMGEFRADLYDRLRIMEIHLPPLRERVEDIPLLVKHFCDRFNRRFGKDIQGVSLDVLTLFMQYPWPGNVGEIESAMEYAFVLGRGESIAVQHIPPEIKEWESQKPPPYKRERTLSAQDVLNELEKAGGNRTRAARAMGMSRQTLYRLMIKHRIVTL